MKNLKLNSKFLLMLVMSGTILVTSGCGKEKDSEFFANFNEEQLTEKDKEFETSKRIITELDDSVSINDLMNCVVCITDYGTENAALHIALVENLEHSYGGGADYIFYDLLSGDFLGFECHPQKIHMDDIAKASNLSPYTNFANVDYIANHIDYTKDSFTGYELQELSDTLEEEFSEYLNVEPKETTHKF